jgi:YidC/Oxa1 family membrane protein insertase
MEKRFFVALILSFMVLMAYSAIMPKPKNAVAVVNKEVISSAPVNDFLPTIESEEKGSIKNVKQAMPYSLENKELGYSYETKKLKLTFSKKGGYITEAFDKAINAKIDFGAIGYDPQFASYLFDIKEDTDSVIFSYKDQNGVVDVEKTFVFTGDYSFRLSVVARNVGLKSFEIYSAFMTPLAKPDPVGERYNEVAVFSNNLLQRKPAHGIKGTFNFSGKILWAGLRDKYFCSVIFPQHILNQIVIEKETAFLASQKVISSVEPGQESHLVFDYYVGPQNARFLENFKQGTGLIVNYGAIDLVAKALLFLINIAHSVTNNWGWSIILMTIIVFVVLSPLSIKSFISMKRIQLLQPKMEELKVKFLDNPQKLHSETMELYKREKINPLGGCFPMLLQIPVFVALYQLLMRLIDLKGANFLWIKDLSEPDRFMVFKNSIPFLGNELNILPLLMAGTMFAQQKLTSSSGKLSKESADQQKIMGIMMPVVFGVLFYKISSGLVLYWFVNSLLTLGFQWKISKAKIV